MRKREWYNVRVALDLLYIGENKDAIEHLLKAIGYHGTLKQWIDDQKVLRRCAGCRRINPAKSFTEG